MVNGVRTGQTRRSAPAWLGVPGVLLALMAAPVAVADPVDSGQPEPQAVVDAAPADGVAHLPSPDNLPPGTTQSAPEGPNISYLRYLWQAVHTPGVTLSDALILMAQRPLTANAAQPPAAPVDSSTPASP